MQYPLHLLESRHNGPAGDLWSTVQSELNKSSRAAVTAAMPGVSTEIQKIAEAKAVDVINTVSNLIPNQTEMIALGNKLVADIEKAINENILPQLYNRVALGAAFLSEAELRNIYNRAIAQVPNRTTFDVVLGQSLTLDLKKIVQSALPFSKFMELVRKIEPLTYTVKNKTLPLVEGRIKDVATFTLFTGMLAGGLVVFGYMKLYNSMD